MSDASRAERAEALFAELANASAEHRAAELANLSDRELAAEVTRLLAAHDDLDSAGEGFLGGLDAGRVRSLVDAAPGDRIGRYPVVRRLGQGGMGVVYLARDPRLDRPVAIKLLPPHLGSNDKAVLRLASEARTASALDHPNIAAVHEIAETDDGRPFIVMAYYDGETLRERLARGPLSVDEALSVGIQLAEGLGAAHRAGIIHRDIKPENVMLTGEGRVVILDFGIAKAAGANLVTGGLMRGTAAYMSPEQSRSETTDPRTDIWSTGVVLHELLTGSRPFPGEGSALIHAIREDPPATLALDASDLPPGLAELVRKSLAKSPASRPASAGQLAAALREIRGGRAPGRARRRSQAVVLAALALVAAAALAVYRAGPGQAARAALTDTASVAAPGIAVLPFEVRGSDLQIWREGVVDLLSANLDGVTGLRAIDSRTVLARWGRSIAGGDAPDLGTALGVAGDVGARYAVLGSMVPNGDALRLAVRVHSVTDGAQLAAFSIDGPADSLFSLVDQITINVLAAVWQGSERPAAEVDLGRITTRSLPALKAFLNGERLLRQGDYPGAVAEYRDAVSYDSSFAFALYHLGLAQVWIGNPVDSTWTWQRAMHEAVRHSGQLPERERLLVRVARAANGAPTAHDLRTTLDLAELAVTRYPDEAEAWYMLAEVYFHSGDQLLLAPNASDTALQRAVAIDSGMTMLYEHLIHNALNVSLDSARTRELLDAYRKVGPGSRSTGMELSFALAFGDSATRRQTASHLSTLSGQELGGATWSLRHPRYWELLTVAFAGHVRSPNLGGAWLTERLVRLSIDRGDVARAARYFTDPLLPAWYGALNAYRARLGGVPLPDSMLERVLAAPPTGEEEKGLNGYQLVIAGAYAAENGRWGDHQAIVDRTAAMARSARDRGDSAVARVIDGSVLALQGYGLGLRGDHQRALAMVTAAQVQTTWSESVSGDAWNAIIRWWVGDLLLTSGRLDEAARYFSSLRHDPYAAERVAPIYERLGRKEEAREAYGMVAEVWKDADPAFRVRAEAARAAAARLEGRTQGSRTPNTGVSPLGTLAGTVRN